jgi:hypothetical protein
MSGDMATAADLVERAIYCLQAAFHPSFKPAMAQCRVSYVPYENRCLFLALFHHIEFIASRGCWRAALETAKFLLALAPDEVPAVTCFSLPLLALWASLFAPSQAEPWQRHGKLAGPAGRHADSGFLRPAG